MGRPTEGVSNPVELIRLYARFYERKVKTGQTHQLYFFSKDKLQCELLTVLGGAVYRQEGGYAWMCGKTKHLVAIYKLLLPLDIDPRLQDFMDWASTKDPDSLGNENIPIELEEGSESSPI